MKEQNLITIKIKYSTDSDLSNVIRQYNSVLRYTYNRLRENPKYKDSELNAMQKSMNNCELIGAWLRGSAIFDAKALLRDSEQSASIFGGKYWFVQRCQHKISREEFIQHRTRPLFSIGEANLHSNRLFQIVDEGHINFKISKSVRVQLELLEVSRKYKYYLSKLQQAQEANAIPITYKLDSEFVYITFDYNFIQTYSYKIKSDRVMAIDLNPNSIGWSIVDWRDNIDYHLVQSGTFSLKALNDYRNSMSIASSSSASKYVTNKRKHELVSIAQDLFNLCKYYRCESFAIEDLNIKSSDSGKGTQYNRTVNNQWNRNLLIQQLRKRILASSTKFIPIQPQWSSVIGNLVYRNQQLPDECLSSIEIGRRGWEFSTQYIFKRRQRQKTVIYPKLELVKNQLSVSLEEIGIDVPNLENWSDILQAAKKSKDKYRFSSSVARRVHAEDLFSKFYKRKYLEVYNYL